MPTGPRWDSGAPPTCGAGRLDSTRRLIGTSGTFTYLLILIPGRGFDSRPPR